MKACTKCGQWHTNAENKTGENMSCSQVKAYWAGVSSRHQKRCGHYAKIRIRKDGRTICMTCQKDLNSVL